MTNNKILVAAGAVALSAGIFSATATAATVTAAGSANVLAPLTITLGTNAMNFGDVAGDATDITTVVLTNLGATSSADGASAAGTPTAGDFDVNGAGNLAYSITLPADGAITLAGPGTAMSVDGFNDSAGGAANLAAGIGSFTVGATLTINANQTAGAYTGNYDVTVNYQ